MKPFPILIQLAVLASFLQTYAMAAAPDADYVVAPGGDDRNPGTAAQPFATPARARNAVREKIKAGLTRDIKVLIRGGRYELDKPLSFGPQDSGTAPFSITYAAAPGEEVILSGGRRISGWKKGEGDIWTAEVPGVKEGAWPFRQLWVDGRRAIRARTPNPDAEPACWQLTDAKWTASGTIYMFQPGQLKPWMNLSDVEAVTYGGWEIVRKRFEQVDSATGEARMAGPHVEHHPSFLLHTGAKARSFFYLENAREFLDQPGEWYLNRLTGTLSYWPRPGEDLSKAEVIVPALTRIIEVRGTPESPVRNLRFQSLTVAYTDWAPPPGGYLGHQACGFNPSVPWVEGSIRRMEAAALFEYTLDCRFADGALAHLGGCGIEGGPRCAGLVIEGNRIHDISGNGVQVGAAYGRTATEEDVPKRCRIANNHLSDCGVDYPGAHGILFGLAQGATIAHNLVHDLPSAGISLGWEWSDKPTAARDNLIEYNHVYDVMKRMGDAGAIYTLGFQPGTVIRGNHLHDVHRHPFMMWPVAQNNGMFIDEGSKGFHFENNVIYKTQGAAVRFNQCLRAGHTWKDNLEGGVTPVVPGKIGEALECDGYSSFLEIQHAPALDPEQFTLEAWIKLTEYPRGNDSRRWIVSKNGSETQPGHFSLVVSRDNVGAYLNLGGADGFIQAHSPAGVLRLNQWHPLAMTYDGQSLRLYVDGVETASKLVGRPRIPGSGRLAIGRRDDVMLYFQGAIDEVRLYSRALPAAELHAHFERPAPVTSLTAEKGLVGNWDFDHLEDPRRSVAWARKVMGKAGLEEKNEDSIEYRSECVESGYGGGLGASARRSGGGQTGSAGRIH